MITHYEDANIKIYKVKCPPFDNNAYLLVCPKTNESIIIDTPDNISDLIKIASNTEVKAILITHNHSDHIQGLTDITSAIPSQVGIAKADSDALLRNPDLLLKDGDITKAGTINLRTIASPAFNYDVKLTPIYNLIFRIIRSQKFISSRGTSTEQNLANYEKQDYLSHFLVKS